MRVEKAIGDCEIVKQDTIKVKQDTILAKEATITATNNANNATSSANSAATEATKKATLAGTAAANADNKAALANEKAVLANSAAQKATEETDKAIAWNTHPPKIEQGVWWVYDITNSVFVNTGFIAVGKSPYISDKLTWVVWDEAAKAFKDTGISVSSQYILTKEAIEAQLTGNITTHTHNYDAAGAAAKSLVDAKNYSDNKFVAKITGKQLSTEDFTTLLKEKLVGIDLAPLQSKITELTNSLNTLIGSGDTTSVIDTFNEIEKFLAGVTNTKSLTKMLSDLQSTIEAKIPTTLPASDVYSWAKQPTKPSYTASEVGALGVGGTAVNSNLLGGKTLEQVNATAKGYVDGLEIGGVNLLKKSDLKKDSGYFTGNQTVSLTNPTNDFLRVIANQDNSTPGIRLVNTGFSKIPINIDFVISFDIKPINISKISILPKLNNDYAQQFNLNNDWQNIKAIIPHVDDISIYIIWVCSGYDQGFDIKNVKIEAGYKPTAWSPAPEDMILKQGTNLQFIKGDGSLDSTEYLHSSDIFSWAKQPTKPSYTASEVGALESGGTAANSTKLAGLTLQQVQASVKPTVQDMTATTATLQPNILYKWESVASLTITLAAASGYAEYMFEFVSGATATTLTLPASIKGEVSIEANKTYQ